MGGARHLAACLRPHVQAELERWGIVLIYGTLGFVLSLPRLHPAAAEVLSEEELQVVEGSPKAVYAVMARLRVLVGGAVLPAEKVGAGRHRRGAAKALCVECWLGLATDASCPGRSLALALCVCVQLLAMNDSIARGMDACCSCMGVLEQATPQVRLPPPAPYVKLYCLASEPRRQASNAEATQQRRRCRRRSSIPAAIFGLPMCHRRCCPC